MDPHPHLPPGDVHVDESRTAGAGTPAPLKSRFVRRDSFKTEVCRPEGGAGIGVEVVRAGRLEFESVRVTLGSVKVLGKTSPSPNRVDPVGPLDPWLDSLRPVTQVGTVDPGVVVGLPVPEDSPVRSGSQLRHWTKVPSHDDDTGLVRQVFSAKEGSHFSPRGVYPSLGPALDRRQWTGVITDSDPQRQGPGRRFRDAQTGNRTTRRDVMTGAHPRCCGGRRRSPANGGTRYVPGLVHPLWDFPAPCPRFFGVPGGPSDSPPVPEVGPTGHPTGVPVLPRKQESCKPPPPDRVPTCRCRPVPVSADPVPDPVGVPPDPR